MSSITDFSNITVDTLVDENDGDFSAGDVSLREAIALIEEGGTIDFASDIAQAAAGEAVIRLSLGSLQVNTGVTIQGLGAQQLTVEGNGEAAVFDVNATDVTLAGLTITGGTVGVATYNPVIEINDSVITGNSETGVINRGSVSLTNTDVTDNGNHGVYAYNDIEVVGGSISGNQADGLSSEGNITVTDAAIRGNGDDGVSSSLRSIIRNSVISGNVDAVATSAVSILPTAPLKITGEAYLLMRV